MSGLQRRDRVAPRRATVVAVGSVLAALVGGGLLAAPASASPLGASDACGVAPIAIVDGATDPVQAVTAGPLGCEPSAAPVDGPAQTASTSATPTAAGEPTTTDPAPPADAAPGSTGTTATAGAPDPAPSAPAPAPAPAPSEEAAPAPVEAAPQPSSRPTAAAAPSAMHVSHLAVLRSSNTVYPVQDGYRDSVRFAVHAWNASGSLVPAVGEAVLWKAGKELTSWHLSGATRTLTWNGRVGHRIEAGLYTLKVTVWSPDGSTTTGHTLIRVLSQHLVRHTVTVRSNVGSKSVSANMPRELLKAYRTGKITCRVVTVAVVRGPAKLVFSNNGVSRSIVLRNGSHTTKPMPVPQGFNHVTITHRWAKGAAHLKSLKAIWSYSTLS